MSTLLRIGRPTRVCGISPHLQFTRCLSDRVDRVDRINPPISTLPAPVNLPTRDEYDSKIKYWLNTGKAYLSFFKTGVKNVWANSKVARELRRSKGDDLTRAEFQLIARSRHDMSRLPIFAIVFIICGEFTLLVAPFMAGIMPKTCRPPQIEEGLARRAETQRKIAAQRWESIVDSMPQKLKPMLRESPYETMEEWTNVAGSDTEGAVLVTRASNTLWFKLACMYDLYTKPMFKLREKTTHWGPLMQAMSMVVFAKRETKRFQQHYAYLVRDSILLLQDGGPGGLSTRELRIACLERGIDVLGRPEGDLRHDLSRWLSADERKRQKLVREAMPEMKEIMQEQWTEMQKSERR